MAEYTFNNVPFDEDGEATVGVLGAPSGMGASTAGGDQSEAPRAVRLCYEAPTLDDVVDLGDVMPVQRNMDNYTDLVADAVAESLDQVSHLVVIGGDDSISYAVCRGVTDYLGTCPTLYHFDAHEDREEDGDELDHSNWVRLADQEGYVGDVMQIGVRAPGSPTRLNPNISGKRDVVIVVDMDVLDPAYAPGVTVPEPFGMPSEILRANVLSIATNHNVIALVVTEIAPSKDVNELTARTAFRLIYDFIRVVNPQVVED